jgi:hypothetical protein
LAQGALDEQFGEAEKKIKKKLMENEAHSYPASILVDILAAAAELHSRRHLCKHQGRDSLGKLNDKRKWGIKKD